MSPERLSGLKLYSLGIVVQDKQAGSDQIFVTPVEELPTIMGDFSKTTAQSSTIDNAQGGKKTTTATSQNTIVASWIPFGHSNRMTAPDVVKNETVIIFRYHDTSDYYWTTIFREPSLRRQETVLYSFSNLKKGIQAFDPTTSYWFLVDTVNKKVQLHTSNNDNEACTYDLIIDTSQGQLTVEDNLGNSFVLQSPQGIATATTTEQIHAVTKHTRIDSSEDVTINTQQTTINTTQSITVNTQTATVNASSSAMLQCPQTTITGNVNVDGNLSVGGAISGGGGSFTASGGNVNASGNISAPQFTGHLNGTVY